MRSLYVVLLTVFVAFVWVEQVSHLHLGGAYVASRMAETGKYIIEGIVVFQFFAIQVLAIIMLSGSISDEVSRRTLHVLMSTPVNSFQIVMGKLLSRLLQLTILLAISLPLLAIVRVFGGVPWGFLVSSFCITVTAAIFVGSISLFFSIFFRRFYAAIAVTTLVIVAIHFLVPLFVLKVFERYAVHDVPYIVEHWKIMSHLNPFLMLGVTASKMLDPASIPKGLPMSWPIHCGAMLCISVAVLLVSARFVRPAALRQAAGKRGFFSRLLIRLEEWSANRDKLRTGGGAIRRVRGPAIIWKELIRPVSRRQRLVSAVIIGAELLLLLMAYAHPAAVASLGHPGAVLLNVWLLMGLGIVFTSISPATSITSEKETSSWPLLLATTSSDWQILLGKFTGALRRCLLMWAVLFFYFVVFWRVGVFHPLGIGQITMVMTGTIVFLCGVGFYFSSRFKSTNNAIVATFAFISAVWFFVPLLLLLATVTLDAVRVCEAYMAATPFGQALIVVSMTGDSLIRPDAVWFGYDFYRYQSTFAIVVTMLGYVTVGAMFAWRAKCRFRRDVF